ncbi:MAG TPA: hypothetical protein VHR88_08000 [Solirubrobacteraceae bacterium]|jgi:hypothetical protein|nr:hypothetical protein [Solirubrobacteraceae bacterium]
MWSEQVSGGLADEHAKDLRRAATRPGAAGGRIDGTATGRRTLLARLRGRLARSGVAGYGVEGADRAAIDRTDGAAVEAPAAALERVTIRRSRAADREALVRLAQLDSRRLADGDLLVAEVEGELRAALPLAGGHAIADPFRPTAPLVSLLGLRAAQIRAADAGRAGEADGAAPLYVPRAWSAR